MLPRFNNKEFNKKRINPHWINATISLNTLFHKTILINLFVTLNNCLALSLSNVDIVRSAAFLPIFFYVINLYPQTCIASNIQYLENTVSVWKFSTIIPFLQNFHSNPLNHLVIPSIYRVFFAITLHFGHLK